MKIFFWHIFRPRHNLQQTRKKSGLRRKSKQAHNIELMFVWCRCVSENFSLVFSLSKAKLCPNRTFWRLQISCQHQRQAFSTLRRQTFIKSSENERNSCGHRTGHFVLTSLFLLCLRSLCLPCRRIDRKVLRQHERPVYMQRGSDRADLQPMRSRLPAESVAHRTVHQ